MMQTILSIENGVYPYDETFHPRSQVSVEELAEFQSKQSLNQKKIEIQRRMKQIDSSSVIKLLKISQQNLCLHYFYEWIPLSLGKYLQLQVKKEKFTQLKQMTAKLLIKKMTGQINSLSSELAKIRVQTSFNFNLFGISGNKLKLFINADCQIGRKSQLLLKQYYRNQKEVVIMELQKYVNELIKINTENVDFTIKGNKLVFGNKSKQSSSGFQNGDPSTFYDSKNQSFFLNNSSLFSQSCSGSEFTQHTKKRNYSQNKRSSERFSEPGKHQNQFSRLRNTQSPSFTKHFNFQSASRRNSRKNEKSFQCNDDSMSMDDDNFDGKSFTHSKSIRIELQKNKKKRKDSYKVKIITCHQYEMDDIDPNDLFQKAGFYESNHAQPAQSAQKQEDSPRKTVNKSELDQKIRMAREKANDILKGYIEAKRKSRK